jgi:transcription antitermination factor NusA-like protein
MMLLPLPCVVAGGGSAEPVVVLRRARLLLLLVPAREAEVKVSEDQQSLAIGKGGQNVRLAAKLTGWKIDIQSKAGAVSSDEVMGNEETTADAQ